MSDVDVKEDVDLYAILGLPCSATDADIKEAYERLKNDYNPENIPNDDERLTEIQLAYDVLSDSDKRELYDTHGMDGFREDDDSDDAGPGFSSDSLFEGLFGGGSSFSPFGGMRSGGRPQRRVEDIVLPLEVTLVDLYNGKTTEVEVARSIICSVCQGKGGKAGALQKCTDCRGRGVTITHRQIGPGMIQQMQSACSDCQGSGEMINEKDRCKACLGKRVTPQTTNVEVQVTKGMKHNQKIILNKEGNQAPDLDPSDVVVVLQQKEHEVFKRTNNDLTMTYELSMVECLCGVSFSFKHLDDRDIVIHNPPGVVIEPGAVRCVMGEGMPKYKNPTEKGNLLIKFEIVFPSKNFVNPDELKALAELLPNPAHAEIPTGEHVEEVNMMDFEPKTEGGASGRRSEAYHADSDDDDDNRGSGMHGAQCAHQ